MNFQHKFLWFQHERIFSQVYKQVYQPYVGKPAYVCIVSHLQPKSRGEIKLNSTDPYVQPLINPNYFKEEDDIRDMVAGKLMWSICANFISVLQIHALSAKWHSSYNGQEENRSYTVFAEL